MTTAMLMTFAMALGTAASGDVTPPVPLHIEVTVFKGDPLGSRDEGTLKILAQPVIRTLSNRPATFQSGGQVAVPAPDGKVAFEPVGLTLNLTPAVRADGAIRLDVDAQMTEVAAGRGVVLGNGQTVHAFNRQEFHLRRTVKDAQTVRVRLDAKSPTDQVWVELSVHVVR